MKIKFFKLHPNAVTPSYGNEGDAALDLTAVSVTFHPEAGGFHEYSTGIAMEIPENHVGLLFPRSSVTKHEMMLKNSVGVIDPTYRGDIKLRFIGKDGYKPGDKIGQILIIPFEKIELEEVLVLSNTNRGDKGFGSTGN